MTLNQSFIIYLKLNNFFFIFNRASQTRGIYFAWVLLFSENIQFFR